MPEWMPEIPSWLPSWFVWIVVLITCIGWLIDKAAQWANWSSSNTKKEKDTVALLQEKVQIWKNKTAELEQKIEQNDFTGGQTESKKKSDDDIQTEKSKSETEIEEQEEEIENKPIQQDTLNAAFKEFEKGNYNEGLKLFKEADSKVNGESFDLDFLAFGQHTAFTHGSNKALSDLEKLAEENPANANIAIWLALSYKTTEENNKAQTVLEDAIVKSNDESSIVSAARHLTNIYSDEDEEKAINFYKDLAEKINSSKELARIFSSVGSIYEKRNEYEKAFMFYERSLVQDPANSDLRFDVALLYSENSAPKFALYHYRKILQLEENNMARNNAGVSAGNLSLPITSIKYYKEAKELGNTLAASNIAYKLINAGFAEEAEEILEEVEKNEDVHKNVYSAHASIDERREKENETINDILESVSKIKKWRQKFGKAIFKTLDNPTSLSGVYKGEPGKLTIKVTEKGDLSGELLLENRDEPAEFTGQLEGSGIRFSWKQSAKKKENDTENKSGYKLDSILSSWQLPPRNERGLLIINNQTLEGYSKSGEKNLDPDSNSLTKWKLDKVS